LDYVQATSDQRNDEVNDMKIWINDAMTDVRSGRESWRVLVLLGLPAFTLSFLVAAVQHVY
jgi:hypothetical protein